MQLMKSREGAFMHAHDHTEIARLESLGWTKAKEGDQAKKPRPIITAKSTKQVN